MACQVGACQHQLSTHPRLLLTERPTGPDSGHTTKLRATGIFDDLLAPLTSRSRLARAWRRHHRALDLVGALIDLGD